MDWPSVARHKCGVELLTLIVAGVELLPEMRMRCAIVSSVAFPLWSRFLSDALIAYKREAARSCRFALDDVLTQVADTAAKVNGNSTKRC